MIRLIKILPIIFLIIIVSFLLVFLLENKDPSKPPSALLNENLPELNLESLLDKKQILTSNELKNKKLLINFFASWCAPCKEEHPLLIKIKKENPNLFLLGVNYKDNSSDSIKYLNEHGNPYDFIAMDDKGLVGLEFGVFGLPESFIVNTSGKIIYKHLGPITKKIIKNDIYPNIK